MSLLIVAATEGECAGLAGDAMRGSLQVDVLVTGVGMVATAAQVSRALALTQYDMALNIGLCGAFDRTLALGSVVHVTRDIFSELGAEDGPLFMPADAMGLIPTDGASVVNATPPWSATLAALPSVTGVTVNTVHGEDTSIAAVVARWNPQVETMEGAAFMYACRLAGVRCMQVRAVSNYVERRNRAAWQIEAAITALNSTTAALLDELR
jgi:futalosine hydrolase